jgi:hypothetical protein
MKKHAMRISEERLQQLAVWLHGDILQLHCSRPYAETAMPFPDVDFLKHVFELKDSAARDALADVFPKFPREPDFEKPDTTFVCGAMWEGHALRSQPLFWWRTPKEDEVTQLLAKVFYPHGVSHATPEAFAFLQALDKALAAPEKDGGFFRLPASHKEITSITPEKRTSNGNELDMLFSWGDKASLHKAAVELKFGASWKNDFKDYETLTEDVPQSRKYHIVLGRRDERDKTESAKDWHFCHWLDVLRYWESCLEEQKTVFDPDFIRLRATLWQKAGEHA